MNDNRRPSNCFDLHGSMTKTTQQGQARLVLWLLLQLAGLPLGVAAWDDAGTVFLVGSAVVAVTFVVVFSVLYVATNLLWPKLAIQRTSSGERKDGGTMTDKDSDSSGSDEENPPRGNARQRMNDVSSTPSPTMWRAASDTIKGLRAPHQPHPMEDVETGNAKAPTPRPTAAPADSGSDISVNLSKLLSDDRSQPSFSAMAEAFVRNATLEEDAFPRDDDLWSGYSGGSRSQLSVFDDSSCNTHTMELLQRTHDLTDDIAADLSEEAWLEFLEGTVALQEREGNSKSSLNLSAGVRPDTGILQGSVEL